MLPNDRQTTDLDFGDDRRPASEVVELEFALDPGLFAGPSDDEALNFEDDFNKLTGELQELLQEERRLNRLVLESLDKVKL